MKRAYTVSLPFKYLIKPVNVNSGLHRSFCLIVFFIFYCLPAIHAQQPMNYAVQANIIYRFTKYIEWPDSKKTGDFIIGIVGDSPLTDELKNFIANKTAGGRKIVIKIFASSVEIFNCHILFISEDESNSLKRIVARTAGSSILIVTELEGLAKKGSCINFSILQDHLKLEINKTNIEQRNLSIATELLNLGIVVK